MRSVFLWKSLIIYSIFKLGSATDRPIIGILAQETSIPIRKVFPEYTSYISASYVKALEGSGTRVVPIFINRTETYYRTQIRSLNGLLLPGGNTWFFDKNGYADAGSILYDEAKKMNNEGIHFPILGICLGVELLLFLDNDKKEYRTGCYLKNVALPLEFMPGFENSNLFKNASKSLIDIMINESITINEHIFCITEKNLTKFDLNSKWKVLSTNRDVLNNVTFVSTLESTRYPFAGLQFHPEKNSYEWRRDKNYPHSPNAIAVSRYLFDWLVAQSKLNENKFQTEKEEYEVLISKFHAISTSGKLIYDELYLFPPKICSGEFK